VKLTTHLHLLGLSTSGALPPLLESLHGAEHKHKDNFTFTFTSYCTCTQYTHTKTRVALHVDQEEKQSINVCAGVSRNVYTSLAQWKTVKRKSECTKGAIKWATEEERKGSSVTPRGNQAGSHIHVLRPRIRQF
jgi:hypothetical protein